MVTLIVGDGTVCPLLALAVAIVQPSGNLEGTILEKMRPVSSGDKFGFVSAVEGIDTLINRGGVAMV